MNQFEESVRDIKGLTGFEPQVLPEWLWERLYETFVGVEDDCSDADLVDRHLGGEWLGDWGAAKIDGEEVFVFEYDDECAPDELYEPAQLVEMLRCGMQMVEETYKFDVGTTVVFTEYRQLLPRLKTVSVPLASS